ncbi:LeuA family protein [Pseudoalteromonas sp. MMG022]|uniref:LeuA family protein n=1 Tax=Pseudoalteromonas sp. MMG022 TaxID=2909978 RepID=UPI001F18D235|nr:LeuA family protein [Pseudoalteromonas sp. MMG022]MCF6436734.1 LeuA family protein [Pseudoalteromonas sp. MMG022]
MHKKELIHNWNESSKLKRKVSLLDESLRDGIQSPGVWLPELDEKKELISSMEKLGVEYLDIGFPSANKRAFNNIKSLVSHISNCQLKIKPCCAGRTHIEDIKPIISLSETMGRPIEPLLFIAVSPIRQLVEKWDLAHIISISRTTLEFSLSQGLTPTLVIEDATRALPSTLSSMYDLAIELGLNRIVLCDTVGQSTPAGVREIVSWSVAYFEQRDYQIGFDWHGHNDRGLALINSMEAILAGCDRIHGTALGIGERTGNAAIDQIIVNLFLQGYTQWDVSKLKNYVELSATYFKQTIPDNYPVFGANVFKTASGVHAAAIRKSKLLENPMLCDLIYSSVPASAFSRENEIEINYMSGKANVINWLEQSDVLITSELVDNILKFASQRHRPLTDDEIYSVIEGVN